MASKYVMKKGKKLKGCYRVTTKKPKGKFVASTFRMVVHSGKSAALIGKLKSNGKSAAHETLKRVRLEKCK